MGLALSRSLPAELRRLQIEIEGHARSYGLDFFDVIFEVVTSDELNEIAALGGFPNRYPIGDSAWSTNTSQELPLRPLEDLRAGHQ